MNCRAARSLTPPDLSSKRRASSFHSRPDTVVERLKYLRGRWQDEFAAKFDVLLYDLTSTYFESDPPFPEGDKRRFGYSRDKRPDCVQVVIALVVTTEGYPLAYEVMAGNTSDKTTLKQFLEKIEKLHGKANRVWVMDRGIPTEEVILEMQQADPQIRYLVGTPKGRLTRLKAELVKLPWQQARPSVRVKLLPKDADTTADIGRVPGQR